MIEEDPSLLNIKDEVTFTTILLILIGWPEYMALGGQTQQLEPLCLPGRQEYGPQRKRLRKYTNLPII